MSKKSTAIGLGIQKLYTVSRNKIVEYRADYYIDAKTQDEADDIWEKWQMRRLKDPTATDDRIHYFYTEDFSCADDYNDTNYTTVSEVKFDPKNQQHQEVLKKLDPDEC